MSEWVSECVGFNVPIKKNQKVVRARTACHFVHQLHHAIGASRHQRSWEAKEDVVRMCEKWYDYMQPEWCQPVRQEFMENECEALPGVAYPGVRDNRSTLNTKTGYDDDDDDSLLWYSCLNESKGSWPINLTLAIPKSSLGGLHYTCVPA